MRLAKKFLTMPLIAVLMLSMCIQVSAAKYENKAYEEVNNNKPEFSEKMIKDAKNKTYESYSKLDSLGRCGVCVASIDQSIMPSEERGEIGQAKPTGWHTVKYSDQINGNYLYNRCHLIGYQLTGENANKKNLITGTRYLNVDGMLNFENEVAAYLKKSPVNKVLYRVTPVFEGNNLVASGVKMEALSLNDSGKAVCFNVYCYNIQPGIDINYKNGDSSLNKDWKNIIKNYTGESVKNDNVSSSVSKKSTAKDKPKVEAPKADTPKVETPKVETPKTDTPSVDNTVCYLSATGKKYHSINNCGKMNPSKATKTTVTDAVSKGMEKCSKCW